MLAFVYNEEGGHRLVVIDESNRRRYEAPLQSSMMAPFWEAGKVYVVAHSGRMQGFSVAAGKLAAEKAETISAAVVHSSEYVRSQHRLYLVRTSWDNQRKMFCELSVIDFPARKTLWTRRIDDPGSLKTTERYVCVTGLNFVQVFNCNTGEMIATAEAPKRVTPADADAQK